jgi:thiol-disulfide isomerase/thioredoxin
MLALSYNRIYFILIILLVSGCNEVSKEKPVALLPDSAFNKVKLSDLKNNSFSLKQFEGKTIFLNFWATWCKPCIAEMPTIEKAKSILNKEDVVFLVASGESAEEIEAFRKAHSYKFNYLQVLNSEELDIQSLPTTFIFNPAGQLVFSESGYRKWDEKSNIEMILKIINKHE